MSRLEEEYANRLAKKKELESQGISAYPARSNVSCSIRDFLKSWDDYLKNTEKVDLAGRIKVIRLHGGSCFFDIDDGTSRIQCYIKRDEIGSDAYSVFKDLIDSGDFVQVTGSAFTTKKGERTLHINTYILLAKALLPLPEKWHGLSDTEIRYRKRYLDLIANDEVRLLFEKRSKITELIRNFFQSNDYLEVETPILQPIPGGANAKPFVTHHNALDSDFYLRIAPELYLKRLIVGGMNRVFEIARCFRNEGIDRSHNPEFTQVEAYAAYWDYHDMMRFTEDLLKRLVLELYSKPVFEHETGTINTDNKFDVITFRDAIQKYSKLDITKTKKQDLLTHLSRVNIPVDKKWSWAKLIDELFKELVKPHLIQPTFLTDHPLELSPLAKKKANDERFVERFQLIVAGTELCNAFSELNDPLDQKNRFEDQESMRQQGDDEAQRLDQDYIDALSHGMPPTAGIGIGIDRLTAVLTNTHSIKEVILFPTLRPQHL